MLLHVLAAIHNTTTLLFGIFLSAFFLGVRQNKSNTIKLLLYSLAEGTVYLLSLSLIGETATMQIYPLFIHLPLALFLTFYYHYTFLSSCVSIVSAYLCCQVSTWIGMFALSLSSEQWCYYCFRIIATLGTYFFLCRYVCHTTEMIFAKDRRELWVIGFLPFVYYIFDYMCTKFSNLLYSGNKAVVEFMGFASCLAYLTFLLIYFKEYERKQQIRQYSDLTKMQLLSIQKEIEQVKLSEQKIAILRHDMRHHLTIILTQLQNNSPDHAMDYIKQLYDSYDDTVITNYCKDEMINSVISIYHTRFEDIGVIFQCNIGRMPPLPESETDVSTILSNALENALHALQNMTIPNRMITLTISEKNAHLLIQVENTIEKPPKFIDGIPISETPGHGIGVRSIIYYVEKLGGQCHFSVSGNYFTLQIII